MAIDKAIANHIFNPKYKLKFSINTGQKQWPEDQFFAAMNFGMLLVALPPISLFLGAVCHLVKLSQQ
ncbi:MAG: hypothetical protein KC423_22005 [Anaerolineales bacterium]|nr:hypothetical protein [Anaerolineales bacterium]